MDIKRYEYPIQSKDGLNLYIRKWVTNAKEKGILILTHGFSEHCGRYTHWAEKFVSAGFHVYALDYRGHGKAEGIRGHTPSYKHLLDDIESCLEHIQNPDNLPVFLYGQSLGGNMVLNYAIFRKHSLTGIISTSPWLKLVAKPRSIAVFLSRIIRILAPRLIRNTKFDINVLSHDPQVVIDYEKDPLTHSFITPQLFFGSEKAAKSIFKNVKYFSVPVLLLHGTEDLVTSFKASKKLATIASNFKKNVTFIPWEGYYHELHNEVGKEQVFAEIIRWINLLLTKKQTDGIYYSSEH